MIWLPKLWQIAWPLCLIYHFKCALVKLLVSKTQDLHATAHSSQPTKQMVGYEGIDDSCLIQTHIVNFLQTVNICPQQWSDLLDISLTTCWNSKYLQCSTWLKLVGNRHYKYIPKKRLYKHKRALLLEVWFL